MSERVPNIRTYYFKGPMNRHYPCTIATRDDVDKSWGEKKFDKIPSFQIWMNSDHYGQPLKFNKGGIYEDKDCKVVAIL